MLRSWLLTFAHDSKVHIALLLVIVDFIFGVAAAVKGGVFRLSYVADFAKNDVLFKLLPYLGLYILALIAGGTDIVIPGLDFGALAGAFYVAIVAAWVGSILASLAVFGITKALPASLVGPEKVGPVVVPPKPA